MRKTGVYAISKRGIFILVCIMLFWNGVTAFTWPGYRLLYREQLYKLYHKNFYLYPENFAENIYWLEQVLRADYANPLNALARIETKQEWEWYRHHFTLHVNLLLLKNYLQWARGYMKHHAYFYNEPWKEQNVKSLEKAQALVEFAQIYWQEALKNVENIKAMNMYFMNLEEIQNWEDEYFRIRTDKLDYETIINRELARIERIKTEFLSMDETTY